MNKKNTQPLDNETHQLTTDQDNRIAAIAKMLQKLIVKNGEKSNNESEDSSKRTNR